MPTVLHTWTHPTTSGLAFIIAADAAVNALQIPAPLKTTLNGAVMNIGMELVLREFQAALPGAPAATPYVITLDQTGGGLTSEQGVAQLQQVARGLKTSAPLPPEIAEMIQIWTNPSNRYRILTQIAPAAAQVRVQVFT